MARKYGNTDEITAEWVRQRYRYEDGNLIARQYYSARWSDGRLAGSAAQGGYRQMEVTVGGGRVRCLVHRLVYLWHHGWMPHLIDHTDGNPSNNRIENLRAADHQRNFGNKRLPGVGFKGVTPARPGRWRARIGDNTIGAYFRSAEEAAAAYNCVAREWFGDFARLNILPPGVAEPERI